MPPGIANVLRFQPEPGQPVFVLHADVPMDTVQGIDYFKKIAASNLASQIVSMIEPEFVEENGFEILRYSLISFRNGEDGRNMSGPPDMPTVPKKD